MAYALKAGGCVTPLTGLIDPQLLLHSEGNTIVYEKLVQQNDVIRGELFRLFSTAASPAGSAASLKQLLCCLPMVQIEGNNISYNNIFRIIIMQFLDAHNFDVRSVKKSCVHIVHPDGRIIPFDTFNMFYRDDKERQLDSIRGGSTVPITIGGQAGAPAIA
jgi:hypothetical protein